MSALTIMLPVPLWFVVLLVALCVVWQVAMWGMARCLRELYAIYEAGRARSEESNG